MDARELRIGNFVGLNLKDLPDNYFTVVEVAESSAVFTDGLEWHPIRDRQYFEPADVEGIPLTSSWLERFGFEWYDEEETNYDWGYKIGDFKISEMEFTDEETEYHFDPMDIQVKTVHQLQNLYYALTGNELELLPQPPQQQ